MTWETVVFSAPLRAPLYSRKMNYSACCIHDPYTTVPPSLTLYSQHVWEGWINQPHFYMIWLCPFGSWYRIRSSWSNGSQCIGLSVTSDMHDLPQNDDLGQSQSHCHLHGLRKERIRPLILGLKLRIHRKKPLRQICSQVWEIRFKSMKGWDNRSSRQKLWGCGDGEF